MQDHNILAQITRLEQQFNSNKAEQLDACITLGMKTAENLCRIFDRLPWSPQVNQILTTLHILRLRVTELRSKCDRSTQIRNKQYLLDEPMALPRKLKEAQKALTAAQEEYRKLCNKSRQNMANCEEENVEAYVAAHPEVQP